MAKWWRMLGKALSPSSSFISCRKIQKHWQVAEPCQPSLGAAVCAQAYRGWNCCWNSAASRARGSPEGISCLFQGQSQIRGEEWCFTCFVSFVGPWWGDSCWPMAMAFPKIWYSVAVGFLLPFSYAHTDFFTSIGETCLGLYAVGERISWWLSKLILWGCVNGVQSFNWYRTKSTS